MKDFIAIDFETGNPNRVSACALGYARVSGGELIERKGFLIKPIGGHAPFQSKIHGIKDEHTFDKPDFGELFSEISEIFSHPLVGHSLFDKQVLNTLSDHFGLRLAFEYTDSCAIAKENIPHLANHKLKTLSKHFKLPPFKSHDAKEDAVACANIFLKLQDKNLIKCRNLPQPESFELKGLAMGILADDVVNYKEAYSLLYWFEDNSNFKARYHELYERIKLVLGDDHLDNIEAKEIKQYLIKILKSLEIKN